EINNMTVASKTHKNNAVKNVSLKVRAGEIVCIAGIDGNGQTEFVHGLTGLEPLVSGSIKLKG
ncbi:MAG: heme ABC transporter ATP-binding protein, partial [Spirochaetales bacterium]|nr:heme ABC transporter ATP-binding protein [Spirochaetales bacterium]